MSCSSARPGLGKTTLAGILAREMGVGFRATSGPVIAKSGDLAALLTNLEDGDVLFIDEIHRLNPAVEEVLYPAMEDRALDLMIGEGPSARSVRIDLPHFTLIGATTRQGLLTTPLRDRFGIPIRLNFYSVAELEQVVRRAARLLSAPTSPTTASTRSPAARAAPRASPAACSAGCAISPMPSGTDTIDADVADRALDRLEIDGLGLDAMDRRYLMMIADLYGGGPVGVETLAAGLSASRATRSRTSSSPSSFSSASSPAPHAAAASTAAAGPISGLNPPAGGADRPVRHWRRSEMMRRLDRGCRRACSRLPPPPNPPPLRLQSIIPRPPTGCACPAAPTSARRRCRPPRSTPTAMARPAAVDRRQGPAARLLLRLSDRVARPRPQQRSQHVGGNRRRRRPGRALLLGLQGLCAEISADDGRRDRRLRRRPGHHRRRHPVLWRRRSPPGATISPPATRAARSC